MFHSRKTKESIFKALKVNIGIQQAKSKKCVISMHFNRQQLIFKAWSGFKLLSLQLKQVEGMYEYSKSACDIRLKKKIFIASRLINEYTKCKKDRLSKVIAYHNHSVLSKSFNGWKVVLQSYTKKCEFFKFKISKKTKRKYFNHMLSLWMQMAENRKKELAAYFHYNVKLQQTVINSLK